MRNLLLAVFVLIKFSIFAQSQEDNTENVTNTKNDLFASLNLTLKTTEVNNSVYLFNEWSQFSVILQTGKILDAVIAKYDIQNNQFEIRNDNSIGILNGNRVKAFGEISPIDQNSMKSTFSNIKNFELKNGGKYKKGFVQQIFKGEKKGLYKYYTVKVIETSGNTALGIKGEISFSKNEETVVYDSKSFSKVESNKKKNLRFFGNEASQVLGFIKENKLSFRKEEDVMEIFTFYDELEPDQVE